MTTPSGAAAAAIRVLALSGSLRTGSYNSALLREIPRLAPEGVTIEIVSIADVPLYNYDVEQGGDPPAVVALKDAMAAADAFLFVTPEYQHGVPGVLKNALDWASRPPGHSPMEGKAAAVMGASPGVTGTARAQEQLRQSLTFSNVSVVPGPEVLIGRAHEKVDASGRFTDRSADPFIAQLLVNLARLARLLRPPQ